MYLDNKYTIWYNKIISNAKSRVNPIGYMEKHHIIPSSLGGTNRKDNLVFLTPREHFICHVLLTKMTIGNHYYKMCYALNMLSNIKNIGNGRYTPTSKLYDYAKRLHKEAIAASWTPERRARQSELTRAAKTGLKWSEERKKDWGQRNWTQKALETRLQNCLKAAESRKGSKWSNDRHDAKFQQYIEKNKHLFPQVLELYDSGLSIRQVSLKLDISWDRVKYIIDNKERLNTV